MGLVLYLIAGLVVWVVGWGVGWKSFDVFLITATILLVGISVRMFAPALIPGRSDD